MIKCFRRQSATHSERSQFQTGGIAGFLAACFLLLIAAPEARSIEPSVFRNPAERMVITPQMQWFMDVDEDFTPATARDRFLNGQSDAIAAEWGELGIMDGVAWLFAEIHNESGHDKLIIEFRNPRMNHVDCYVLLEDGTFKEMRSGSVWPMSDRPIRFPMPAFPVQINSGESAQILIRLDNVGDFRFRVWLWESLAFYNRALGAYDFEKISVGFLSVLAVYHLLIFISLREKTYLFLCFFITSWMFFFMANTGLGKLLLWDGFSWLSHRSSTIFTILMSAAFILFCMSFLESKKYTPGLYRLGNWGIGAWGLHFVFSSLTDNILRMDINRVLMTGTLALVAALVIQAIRKGSRMAIFFALSWVFLLIGGIVILLLTWYILPARWVIGSPLINFMFTTSILLWSFELTGRVKGRAREQRRILKEQVAERTRDLQQALDDVKTLSGLLPICSSCKKIRDDGGYWNSVEHYLAVNTDADFTHGICPDCMESLYGDYARRRREPAE